MRAGFCIVRAKTVLSACGFAAQHMLTPPAPPALPSTDCHIVDAIVITAEQTVGWERSYVLSDMANYSWRVAVAGGQRRVACRSNGLRLCGTMAHRLSPLEGCLVRPICEMYVMLVFGESYRTVRFSPHIQVSLPRDCGIGNIALLD
jgi:hypothetical protein